MGTSLVNSEAAFYLPTSFTLLFVRQGFGNAVVVYTSTNIFAMEEEEASGLEVSKISALSCNGSNISHGYDSSSLDNGASIIGASIIMHSNTTSKKDDHEADMKTPLLENCTISKTLTAASGLGMTLRGISHKDLIFASAPKVLGSGAAGLVFKAKLFHCEVAVKKITGLTSIPDDCKEEAVMQVNLRHPNVLRLLGVVLDVPTIPSQIVRDFWIVLEFASRGSIADLIHNKSRQYELRHVLMWAQHACLGLAYLHTRKVPLLHRDMKVNRCSRSPAKNHCHMFCQPLRLPPLPCASCPSSLLPSLLSATKSDDCGRLDSKGMICTVRAAILNFFS